MYYVYAVCWYWILCNRTVSLPLNRFAFFFLSHSDCRLSIFQSHTFATCNWIAFAEVCSIGMECVCVLHVPQAILPFIQRNHWKPVFWLQQQRQLFQQKQKYPTNCKSKNQQRMRFFHPDRLICSQNNIILCTNTITTQNVWGCVCVLFVCSR